jgi:periplasmic copper chaperone A
MKADIMKALITAVALALSLASVATAHAQGAPTSTIEIMAPWARATPGGAKNGAAYMTILNKGKEADRLVAVSTTVAKTAAMHRTETENGVMKMLAVDAVDVRAGSQAVFKPGGYHVMLMDLKQPLVEGESFPMTLTFEKAGIITVTVKVQKIGAADDKMGHMQQDMGGMRTE